uniref:Putative secreted protein n=1 Tax=Ixodes ricinus TaxID=34613 RepID=A0A6B0UCM6_IXORI
MLLSRAAVTLFSLIIQKSQCSLQTGCVYTPRAWSTAVCFLHASSAGRSCTINVTGVVQRRNTFWTVSVDCLWYDVLAA